MHHALVTNRTGPLAIVEAEQRRHSVVELAIRDLKDQALAHFPSGRYSANSAWMVIAALAHDLLRRTHAGAHCARSPRCPASKLAGCRPPCGLTARNSCRCGRLWTHMRRLAAVLTVLLLVIAADAQAVTMKKGLYSTYAPEDAGKLKQLGVTLNTRGLSWADVALRRPDSPTDPADPAYNWPSELDAAISTNDALGIDTSLQVIYAPEWANGGRPGSFRPSSARDYANFIAAAAKRYPSVRLWQIWGEVNGGPYVWQPQPTGIRFKTKLTREQRHEPEFYARMLDASYVALKSVNRKNKVIGGMTVAGAYYSPATPPATWMKYMRLPNGKRPRMDLFGHNPMLFARRPDLTQGPRFAGWRDMSDLDTTIREIDRYFPGRKLPIFVSEFAIWDKPGGLNWHVNRPTQARWTRLALGIARRSKRVHTFSWASLRDVPALPGWGLLDKRGDRKPAFRAFADG